MLDDSSPVSDTNFGQGLKCHSCVAKGMRVIRFWTLPERHHKFKQKCAERGTNMSDVLNHFIHAYCAEEPGTL